MSEEGMERRLTTILASDVVGYSRLMAADEAGTLAQLKTHRKELIEPKTAEYHGRVVKLMGDGTLMEFGSVVDAVNFAVDLQRAMAGRNADVPEDRRITYRIGINIGDIIVEGDDIYGDGVNIAARLEGLAEPGGICVARNVYNQVKTKVEASFEDLGEKEVKNIPEPLRVYRVATERLPSAATSPATKPLPLPDKPSIAVLPFDNMSLDPDQGFFADGIAEDIITELSKFRSLFVIARNSSFSFKGQAINVKELSEKLGVRYIVEGSVRRVGKRVRNHGFDGGRHETRKPRRRNGCFLYGVFSNSGPRTGHRRLAVRPNLGCRLANRIRDPVVCGHGFLKPVFPFCAKTVADLNR